MSGRIVGEVFQHGPPDLPPTTLLVWVCLAERAFDNDRLGRKSRSTIARECHLTERSVTRALAELTTRGLISRKGRTPGPRQARVYYLVPVIPPAE